MLYQWNINFSYTGSGYGTADYNGVTIGEANKLTPEQYQLEYLVGKANISGSTLRLVPTTESTGNYDDFRNTELLANDYYRLGTGTTVYQVSSVSSDVKKHILNHTGSETGIQDIYKVLYINATDKNLPGANPYYPRVYNVEQYAQGSNTGLTSLLRNAPWTYTVKAKNYFVSTASSGFSSPGSYGASEPSHIRFISLPTVWITNAIITFTFDESDTSAKTTYANNPEIFNTPDAIDYKSFGVEPFINNVSMVNRYIYTTAQSATRRQLQYNWGRTAGGAELDGMAEGTTSTIKVKFRPENVLDTASGDIVEATFKLLRPAPTSMDSIPLFEWQTDGTNNIKLTLRRSNGGLAPNGNLANNSSGSTICPVTNLSVTGGDSLSNKIRATTDELQWEVKASTALSNGITASFSDYAGTGFTNQDYVIANIGTMTQDTEYEIFFRLKNRYVSTWKESTSPKIKLTKPNAPTNFTAVVDIVDDNAGTDNTITFNWTRPSEPGLHFQHDGAADNAALTADPNTPYIEKYEIYILWSVGGGNYSKVIEVSGGSSSQRAPQTWTITGSQVALGSGGTFYVEPDIDYTFKISAFNVRLSTVRGDWTNMITPTYVSRTRATANIGVPYTIADVDRTIDSGYKPSFNLGGDYTYGNQVTLTNGSAVSGTVKNWNTINNESSTLSSVLLNRYRNKAGSNDSIMKFYIMHNGGNDYTSVVTPSAGSGVVATTSNSWVSVSFGTAATDLFSSGHNNEGQWYKTTNFKYIINIDDIKDSEIGSPTLLKFNAQHLNSSGNAFTSVESTICSNQHFDKVNSASSISGIPTVSYTPYKVTGIPTLYPGKTQTITPSYVIDQKSEYYVNSDYVARVNLVHDGSSFNNLMNYMNNIWKRRANGSHFTNSGTLWTSVNTYNQIGGKIAPTSTSGIFSSKTVRLRILHKNIYGDGTNFDINISGTSYHYFIYDKETYQQMDLTASRALSFIHLTFSYAGTAAHTQPGQMGTGNSGGYLALTILNPPNGAKFDPSTETSNDHVTPTTLTSSSTWSYGIFDGQTDVTSSNCNGMVFYRGKFMSPSYLKSGGTYAHGTSTANHHSSLATLFASYSTTSASDWGTDYKWAFYKYRVQNGPQQGVQPFSSRFYLATGNNTNNTNIEFSDLKDGGGVKICIKTMWNSGSTIKLSGWNQFVTGTTSTNPGQLNATQLSNSTNVPGTTNNLGWTGNVSGKNIYDSTEMGANYPANDSWRASNRKVAFKHAASDMSQSTGTMYHIIAIGIKNNVNKYVGDVFINNTYT